MSGHFHQSRRNERGMSLVIVGLGTMAFMAASMLAIDVGSLMTSRAQSQNAADAGALAGAIALGFNNYSDRSASGPAVTGAIAASQANLVMGKQVSVTPADVQFPNDSNGQPNWVKVTVRRTAARGNPIATLIAGMFGVSSVDMTASATAEAQPANANTCIKPWAIPDKWIEMQTPPWRPSVTYLAYLSSPTIPPDVYISVGQPGYTGYSVTTDVGLQLVLTAAGAPISVGGYRAIDLPGSATSDFQSNVETCNAATMQIGDLMTAQSGSVVTPTQLGASALLAEDPSAYWDSTNKRVVSTTNPSPRTVVIPTYDPYYYETAVKNGNPASLKIANFMGFFIESVQGNGNITGVIVPVTGLLEGNPPVTGAFAQAIRLVQ
jgi:Flp pilus assembly protein TadG